MVNFGEMMKARHTGKIVSIKYETREQSLGNPEKIQAFIDAKWKNLPKEAKELDADELELYKRERLQREGLTFVISVDGEKAKDGSDMVFTQHETKPLTRGYSKSNIKAIIEKNGLPPDSEQWIGKPVELMLNEDGFWRLAV